jgi:hypothetical protein
MLPKSELRPTLKPTKALPVRPGSRTETDGNVPNQELGIGDHWSSYGKISITARIRLNTGLPYLTRLRNQAQNIRDGSERFASRWEPLQGLQGAVHPHALSSCLEALHYELITKCSLGLGEVRPCFRLSYLLTRPPKRISGFVRRSSTPLFAQWSEARANLF